ncbi:MAG: cell division protein ZapA [Acidobacteriota bacterium]|jgi:cell division protein ZapA|nr:cell division protein ZapA [Acidobacteriota bacterium]OQB49908.1 MAG: Cell division protein ZapA [Candidatus Aminicenantes bacterium ADurb.Bin147]HNQ81534.1 cell division protein ZapA [Candidatus Aminicenantes bacterium]MDD8028400.1 cell division protein ZapA [Acidobacteriota bacterium]MDD8032533.1 cell division protein ZapA [Acidobacteriota bacterium]
MSDIVEIEIYGRTYKIRVKGEENEEYISRLTSYVDQKMQEIAVKSRSEDPTKIAVLAALNIADDYFVSRKRLEQVDERIDRMEAEIATVASNLFKDDHA